MSILICDDCRAQIDTDQNPECYDDEQDRWVCHGCRDGYAALMKAEWEREQHRLWESDNQAAIDAGCLVGKL